MLFRCDPQETGNFFFNERNLEANIILNLFISLKLPRNISKSLIDRASSFIVANEQE